MLVSKAKRQMLVTWRKMLDDSYGTFLTSVDPVHLGDLKMKSPGIKKELVRLAPDLLKLETIPFLEITVSLLFSYSVIARLLK